MLNRDKYLTDEEAAAFLKAVRERSRRTSARDRALFLLLITVGVRPAEAAALVPADVHLGKEPRLRVRRLNSRKASNRIDDVPISGTLARVLRGYLRARPAAAPLFPSQKGRGAITVRSIERLFKGYAARAGLRPVYSVYCLRHTAARRMLAALHGDVRTVQVMLGHASSRTTEVYLHVTERRRRIAAELSVAGL